MLSTNKGCLQLPFWKCTLCPFIVVTFKLNCLNLSSLVIRICQWRTWWTCCHFWFGAPFYRFISNITGTTHESFMKPLSLTFVGWKQPFFWNLLFLFHLHIVFSMFRIPSSSLHTAWITALTCFFFFGIYYRLLNPRLDSSCQRSPELSINPHNLNLLEPRLDSLERLVKEFVLVTDMVVKAEGCKRHFRDCACRAIFIICQLRNTIKSGGLVLTSGNMFVAYAAASAGSISSKAIDIGFASVGPNVN